MTETQAWQHAKAREKAADRSPDAPRVCAFLGKHEHTTFSSRKQAPEDRVRAGDRSGVHLELGRAEVEEKGSLLEQPELNACARRDTSKPPHSLLHLLPVDPSESQGA